MKKTADSTAAVDAFMATLDHPHKDAIEAMRVLVRSADPSIVEGIKWNAPSFRTSEYFATTHLRAKNGIALILHLGAKVRALPAVAVEDPAQMLKWLAKDRAIVEFAGVAQVRARGAELQAIIRQWIGFV